MFDWKKFEENFKSLDPSLESLRGDWALIASIKEDIKRQTALERKAKAEWRKWCSERDKAWNKRPRDGGAIPALPAKPQLSRVNRAAMRHVYLAYGWLRFKSLDRIESKAMKSHPEQWGIACSDPKYHKYAGYAMFNSNPDPLGLYLTIKSYVEALKAKVPNVA